MKKGGKAMKRRVEPPPEDGGASSSSKVGDVQHERPEMVRTLGRKTEGVIVDDEAAAVAVPVVAEPLVEENKKFEDVLDGKRARRSSMRTASPHSVKEKPVGIVVRIRPLNTRERGEGGGEVDLEVDEAGPERGHRIRQLSGQGREVHVDYCFEDSSNADIWTALAPLADKTLVGGVGLVAFTGGSSTGKTYSAVGVPGEPGMISRYTEYALRCIHSESPSHAAKTLEMSVVEVGEGAKCLLRTREAAKPAVLAVHHADHAELLLTKALSRRSGKENHHLVVTLSISYSNDVGKLIQGRMVFIDLAMHRGGTRGQGATSQLKFFKLLRSSVQRRKGPVLDYRGHPLTTYLHDQGCFQWAAAFAGTLLLYHISKAKLEHDHVASSIMTLASISDELSKHGYARVRWERRDDGDDADARVSESSTAADYVGEVTGPYHVACRIRERRPNDWRGDIAIHGRSPTELVMLSQKNTSTRSVRMSRVFDRDSPDADVSREVAAWAAAIADTQPAMVGFIDSVDNAGAFQALFGGDGTDGIVRGVVAGIIDPNNTAGRLASFDITAVAINRDTNEIISHADYGLYDCVARKLLKFVGGGWKKNLETMTVADVVDAGEVSNAVREVVEAARGMRDTQGVGGGVDIAVMVEVKKLKRTRRICFAQLTPATGYAWQSILAKDGLKVKKKKMNKQRDDHPFIDATQQYWEGGRNTFVMMCMPAVLGAGRAKDIAQFCVEIGVEAQGIARATGMRGPATEKACTIMLFGGEKSQKRAVFGQLCKAALASGEIDDVDGRLTKVTLTLPSPPEGSTGGGGPPREVVVMVNSDETVACDYTDNHMAALVRDYGAALVDSGGGLLLLTCIAHVAGDSNPNRERLEKMLNALGGVSRGIPYAHVFTVAAPPPSHTAAFPHGDERVQEAETACFAGESLADEAGWEHRLPGAFLRATDGAGIAAYVARLAGLCGPNRPGHGAMVRTPYGDRLVTSTGGERVAVREVIREALGNVQPRPTQSVHLLVDNQLVHSEKDVMLTELAKMGTFPAGRLMRLAVLHKFRMGDYLEAIDGRTDTPFAAEVATRDPIAGTIDICELTEPGGSGSKHTVPVAGGAPQGLLLRPINWARNNLGRVLMMGNGAVIWDLLLTTNKRRAAPEGCFDIYITEEE